jgi:hypothetical protein
VLCSYDCDAKQCVAFLFRATTSQRYIDTIVCLDDIYISNAAGNIVE